MKIASILASCFLLVDAVDSEVKVYTNGRFYTVADDPVWAQAVAVDDQTGVIVAVGTNEEALDAAADGSSEVVAATQHDLQGRLVLPGFHDVHLHAVEAGINAQLCYVLEETPIRDIATELQACENSGRFGGQGWIMGAGIDVGILLATLNEDFDSPLPITILDEAFPDTPVVIIDNLGHAAVVNTKALSDVGLLNAGKVPGGEVIRGGDNGEAWGIVTESVQQVFRDAAFPPTADNQQIAYDSLLEALDALRRNGITSVSDAGGFWRQAQTESWGRAESEGTLTVRASNALYVYPDQPIDEQLPELQQRFSNSADSLVRFNQAKVYVDGILSLTTAALYEPYLEELELPDDQTYGFEYFGSNATLQAISQTLVDNGFQLHFHTVGDRGVGLALDAIESLAAASTVLENHRLTHCYLVDERDRPRFAELGVVADFQLTESSLTTEYKDFLANDIIGSVRANQIVPAKEVYEAGALLTISSDWDADILSPLLKLQSVLNRPDGRSFDRLEDVVPMLTINPAQLLKHDDKTGSIEVGKYADLVVLDRNIFEIPTDEIALARVVLTMLQGEIVYNASVDGLDPLPTTTSASYRSSLCLANTLILLAVNIIIHV